MATTNELVTVKIQEGPRTITVVTTTDGKTYVDGVRKGFPKPKK